MPLALDGAGRDVAYATPSALKRRIATFLRIAFFFFAAFIAPAIFASTVEPPPDPGFEAAVLAADVIAEVEIVAGGPFRAVGMARKIYKGETPAVFEIQGFNSYNWDTVHHGLSTGTRWVLFLSKTERADLFDFLTPAEPRFGVSADGVMTSFGIPPVRIPVKPAAFESCLTLLLEKNATGKIPAEAAGKLADLWALGEIEPRYLAVEMAGALRDGRALPLLLEASKDKLLKMRLRAIEALGKVATPDALGALRGLLADEKKSIAREAARALVRDRDGGSLLALLSWARKNAAVKTVTAAADSEQAKNEGLALEIVALARAAGFFEDSERIARGLTELAQAANEKIAGAALDAALLLSPGTAVPVLAELAGDRLSDLHEHALAVLKRLALKPVRDLDEFNAWWKEAHGALSEDARRDAAEAAVRGLAHTEDADERRKGLDVLRRLPGGVAVVSASPFLLTYPGADYFSADDFTTWNSPLAAPFLIERLGREDSSTRRYALEALVALCAQHPRLNAAVWPLIRAQLSDRDSATRHAAQMAAGPLAHRDAAGALLDAMELRGMYEPADAAKMLYSLTGRTFGFSVSEPVADQAAARESLRGWWKLAGAGFKPMGLPTAGATEIAAPLRAGSGDEAARAAQLEALLTKEDSDAASAAFGVLWAERGPDDGVWKKLAKQRRLRDRANAVLGQMGHGDAEELKKTLEAPASGKSGEPPLLRALALLSLCAANQPAEFGKLGARAVAEWLKGPGAKAPLPQRRLAVLCLGLAPAEETSRAALEEILEAALKADPPDQFASKVDEEDNDYALMRSVLTALCARPDGNSGLIKALLRSPESRTREIAARELSLRRERLAIPGIVRALEHADRYTWLEFTAALEPLLGPREAGDIAGLLESTKNTARAGAVWILSRHVELGNDDESRKKLIAALADESSLVRYYAAESLGKRKVGEAVEPLVKLLDDIDDEVRAAAAQALGEIGDPVACKLVAAVAPLQYRIDARWFKALAISQSEKYSDVILKLANSNLYLEQRAGLEAIAAASQAAGKARLLNAFRSDDEALQTVAADLLVQRGREAVAWVAADLDAKDKAVRARAYHLLARIPAAAARQALGAAAKREDDPNLKALIEWGLGKKPAR